MMESLKDLRVGVWVSNLTEPLLKLSDYIKQHESMISGDFEIFKDNYDHLLSDDIYTLLRKQKNLCLVTTNLPYFTHVDISFSKKSSDSEPVDNKTIGFSPVRFFSPSSSPKYRLEPEDSSVNLMEVGVVFIFLTNDDLKSKTLDVIKSYVSEIIESFKTASSGVNFILAIQGISDLVQGNPSNIGKPTSVSQNDNSFHYISMINELSSYLLVYQDVDTIEFEGLPELADVIALSAKSIRNSYSRRAITKFKSKTNQFYDDQVEKLNKIWISQLLQVPNIGKNEAMAIIKKYKTPSQMIESSQNSKDNFLKELKSIVIEDDKVKTLGKMTANRIATLYSQSLLSDHTL